MNTSLPSNVNWSKQLPFNGLKKINKIDWKFTRNNIISTSSPIFDNESNLIFGANNGEIFSINKFGEMNWCTNIGEGRISSPSMDPEGNILLVANRGNQTYIIKINSKGDKLWDNQFASEIHFEPIVDQEGDAFVATRSELIKVDRNGHLIWNFPCRNISSNPIYDKYGNVYFSAREEPGVLISLTNEGEIRWKKEFGKCYLEYEPIMDASGNIYFIASELNLHSLYSIDFYGNINWKYSPTDRGIISSPALSHDGVLVMGTTYFGVIAINTFGQVLWETNIGHITQNTPVLDVRNYVYLHTQVKKRNYISYIWCLSNKGQPLWNHEFKGAMEWFHFNQENGLLIKTVDPDKLSIEIAAYNIELV